MPMPTAARHAPASRLDDVLQSPAPAPGDEQQDADGGVARRHRRNRSGTQSCGYAASLGQRKRVDHIPTATKAAESCLNLNDKGRVRLHLSSSGPWSRRLGPLQFATVVAGREDDEFSVRQHRCSLLHICTNWIKRAGQQQARHPHIRQQVGVIGIIQRCGRQQGGDVPLRPTQLFVNDLVNRRVAAKIETHSDRCSSIDNTAAAPTMNAFDFVYPWERHHGDIQEILDACHGARRQSDFQHSQDGARRRSILLRSGGRSSQSGSR